MNAPTPARMRWVKRAVHGVLLLDKPLGLSSNDALQKARRLFRAEKAGHTGTLDPLATGLLPLCFGAATKFSQVSLEADKRYRATVTLGQTTSTGDAEGEVQRERAVDVNREAWAEVIARFTGDIDQIPPMHSALKHEGKPLYSYARAGVDIERPPRRVRIHGMELLQGEGAEWVVDVSCSKGTYIRTLIEGMGEALGCGAHLKGLRRLASGPVKLSEAHTLEHLVSLSESERDALLQAPDSLLAEWPLQRLEAAEAGRFLSGLRRRVSAGDTPHVRVYGPEPHAFLGSAHIAGGELIPDRLLSPLEVQGLLKRAVNTPAVLSTP